MNTTKWALAIASGIRMMVTVAIIGTFIKLGGFWLIGALAMSIIGTRETVNIIKDFKRIKKLTN